MSTQRCQLANSHTGLLCSVAHLHACNALERPLAMIFERWKSRSGSASLSVVHAPVSAVCLQAVTRRRREFTQMKSLTNTSALRAPCSPNAADEAKVRGHWCCLEQHRTARRRRPRSRSLRRLGYMTGTAPVCHQGFQERQRTDRVHTATDSSAVSSTLSLLACHLRDAMIDIASECMRESLIDSTKGHLNSSDWDRTVSHDGESTTRVAHSCASLCLDSTPDVAHNHLEQSSPSAAKMAPVAILIDFRRPSSADSAQNLMLALPKGINSGATQRTSFSELRLQLCAYCSKLSSSSL